MTDPLRVAVLGAGGTIAPAIVRDLADSPEIGRMRLLDLDGDRAAAVADAHGGAKASAMAVDAAGEDLPYALSGCDVLVNSASYRFNLHAMRACLAAECHYLDLGGLYWMTGRQLELDSDFRAAGLVGILGIGSSPGKTNLMALRAAREVGAERLDSVHVSAASRDLDPPPGDALLLPYALRTLIDEVTLKPVAIRGGEPVELEPMTASGDVDYGDPIGTAPTIFTLHSELRTFGDSFGCDEASFRLSLTPALLERLRALAAAADEEIDAAARSARPQSARTVSVHRVDAAAGDREVTVCALTRPSEEWGLGGGIVSTASPAAAAVRLIARGRVAGRGVLAPERALDPDDVFPELERRGCTFTVASRQAVGA
ncbi:MAG TPA: saccharopine dehydrogenase NADP-binding domain-containing protein [Thermoleophilaceae bacterium]|nr:saccharopine dehydrogenase NADP-binding domain-containing protein [Thermoleophilaceae bacterium]